MSNLSPFVSYCLSFYGPGGLYDMGLTRPQAEALAPVVALQSSWGDGDSYDRERLRDLAIAAFGLVFP